MNHSIFYYGLLTFSILVIFFSVYYFFKKESSSKRDMFPYFLIFIMIASFDFIFIESLFRLSINSKKIKKIELTKNGTEVIGIINDYKVCSTIEHYSKIIKKINSCDGDLFFNKPILEDEMIFISPYSITCFKKTPKTLIKNFKE